MRPCQNVSTRVFRRPLKGTGKIGTATVTVLVLTAGLFGVYTFGVFGADAGRSPQRRAVMVSIDGLPPELYLHPEKYNLRIPNLKRLKAEGSYAESVEGVYPSVTYPSHTIRSTWAGSAAEAEPSWCRPTWATQPKSIVWWRRS